MTQSREPNDRDLFTRIAQIEYRLMKIENAQAELEHTMTPGGYITEAFERVFEEIDLQNQKIDLQNQRLEQMDSKIDIILSSVTGMGNS